MPKYKLRRGFFDGEQHYRAGEVVEIEEGKAPSSAILLDQKSAPEVESASEPEPELDLGVAVADAKPGDTLSSLGKKK